MNSAMKLPRKVRAAGAALLIGFSTILMGLAAANSRPTTASVRQISQSELVAAMSEEHGYDITATTNAARFQAGIVLRLAKEASLSDPDKTPLFIGHAEWFRALMAVTGRDANNMPQFSLLAFEHKQDQIVDYRYDHVIAEIAAGEPPEMALNVRVSWPDMPGLPDHYSLEDTMAVPHLKITNHRVITYRLLDFGDMVVYDQVRGISGRPTTGALGLLFKLIGDGHVVRSVLALAPDGLLVSHVSSRKGFFRVKTTVTVWPNGRMEKGLPKGRSDLKELERRMKRRVKIRYQPLGTIFAN